MRKVILTSSLGGYIREEGRRIPDAFPAKNGKAEIMRSAWPDNAKVMIVCAAPDWHEVNDDIRNCLEAAFRFNGMTVSECVMCDGRNPETIGRLPEMDVLVLTGGHVPTQNAFMQKIRLKERLERFGGLVIAWSAGSMNCAETVYAGPELPGEAVDPEFRRWIPGLGLTKVNIFPHYEALREETLDGLRLIEDITYADSMGHPILGLNNGSFIVIDEDGETLFGEAYRILDGEETQICRDGESVRLK